VKDRLGRLGCPQASRFERSSTRCSWTESCEVVAIASRKLAKARAAAGQFGISDAYGSYEELLADPNVEAVFNPLPNHLHVPWSIQAARDGKHVLCEKPIGLGADEARAVFPLFSYFNCDPADIRNLARSGGGLLDIGCYANRPVALRVR
jgi:predicted dehydrogenase